MLVPLSGPWARQGILEQMGAEMAIDDINNAGGIKALGGAKLKLMEYDTGDSAEKAKDAAQRMVAQEPDLVGGFGCWLSTFTLAVTEVTERAELPWLTLSYSDLITNRGFKYVFQSSPTADAQAEELLPMHRGAGRARRPASGRPRLAFIGDNTAAAVSFMKPIRDHVLKDAKLDLGGGRGLHAAAGRRDDAGAEASAPRGRTSCVIQSTNVPDDKLLVDKFAEMGMTASQDAAGRRRRPLVRAGTAEGGRRGEPGRRDGRAGELAGQAGGGRGEALHRAHQGALVRP